MCVAIVEDEVLIAYLIQDILNSFGVTDTRLFHTFEEAKTAFESESFDAVLLDLNLSGTLSVPLAELLKVQGTPVLIVSSYVDTILKFESLEGIPALAKPFTDRQMRGCLERIGVL